MAIVSCPSDKVHTANVSSPVFYCIGNTWGIIPDCVNYREKNGSCDDGYTTIAEYRTKKNLCGNLFI